MLKKIIGLLFGLALSTGAMAAGPTQTPTPVQNPLNCVPAINGTLWGMALEGDILYVSGEFTLVGGKARSGLAAINIASGDVLDSFAPVLTGGGGREIIVDGPNMYVAGAFTSINGSGAHSYMAKLDLATGTLDSGWDANVNAMVSRLRLYNNQLYILGPFSSVGGQTRNFLAAVDLVTGAVVMPWTSYADLNNWIYGFELGESGRLFVTGDFTLLGGLARDRLMELDPSDGSPIASFDFDLQQGAPLGGSNGTTLLEHEGILYVAGDFTDVNGLVRNSAAAIDLASNSLTAWAPTFAGVSLLGVIELSAFGDRLVAGGYFTGAGGGSGPYIAKVDKLTGAADAWAPGVNDRLATILARGTELYISGDFTTGTPYFRAYQGEVEAPDCASLSPTPTRTPTFTPSPTPSDTPTSSPSSTPSPTPTFSFTVTLTPTPVQNPLNCVPAVDGTIWGLLMDGDILYLSGAFATVGGKARAGIAAINVATGDVLDNFAPTLAGGIGAEMILDGGTIYVAGSFTSANGSSAHSYMAAFNIADGSLVSGFDPDFDGPTSKLRRLGNTLYVVGPYAMAGGMTRNFLAAIDIPSGNVILPWNPYTDLNGWIYNMELGSSGRLFVTGSFYVLGGQTRWHLAEINPVDGSVITTFNVPIDNLNTSPNVGGASLLELDGVLYVGGRFDDAGGSVRTNAAAIRLSDNTLLPWAPVANVSAPVGALGVLGIRDAGNGELLLLGQFDDIAGTSGPYMAKVDAVTGAPSLWNPGFDMRGTVAHVRADEIYAGGEYTVPAGFFTGWKNEVLVPDCASLSPTPTRTPTFTPSPTATSTPTATSSAIPSDTPTVTQTLTPAATAADTPGPEGELSTTPEPDKPFVYPVPVKKGHNMKLAVHVPGPADIRIRIFTSRGDIASEINASASKPGARVVPVTTSGFAPGVYFYTVQMTLPSGKIVDLKPRKFIVMP